MRSHGPKWTRWPFHILYLRRFYLEKVSVRVSAAGLKFHPVAMSHVRADSANVHLVRPITYRGLINSHLSYSHLAKFC